ncbi:MAG: hypothetical protein ACO1RA_18060 [Planctomycetaceae bacterium]
MTDLEERYRRFQDFGVIVGLLIQFTFFGATLKFAFSDSPRILLAIRVIFYVTLILNLSALYCVRLDSPVLGYAARSKLEIGLGVVVCCIASILAVICFELVS